MGLRQTLTRWRLREQSDAPGTAALGVRVVGPAQLREPEPKLPSFYRVRHGANGASGSGAAQRGEERELVRHAWKLIADRSDQLLRQFYAELFYALGDDAFRMFPPGMEQQRAEFGRVLMQWVTADDPEAMRGHLADLGADHRKFGIEPLHYEAVGQALVTAWSGLAGAAWNPELEQALIASYVRLASLMIDGARANQQQPRSWGATVVGHQRLATDFAVLRVQPDEPYAYKPGQYVTVELATLPKHWRAMSVASAPRPDNTLDLHVRAVGATGVSAALVMHTAEGDRLKLGPPRGTNLVLEPGTADAGVLCVCSGTGAAPICAVVEAMLSWSVVPPVHAFVGARTRDDLYPVEHLRRLVNAAGLGAKVRVHGVVSDDPHYPGYRGRVEQVVPAMQKWADLGVDVLIAGPNAMIASTVQALTACGVPVAKIHFDQFDAAS